MQHELDLTVSSIDAHTARAPRHGVTSTAPSSMRWHGCSQRLLHQPLWDELQAAVGQQCSVVGLFRHDAEPPRGAARPLVGTVPVGLAAAAARAAAVEVPRSRAAAARRPPAAEGAASTSAGASPAVGLVTPAGSAPAVTPMIAHGSALAFLQHGCASAALRRTVSDGFYRVLASLDNAVQWA